LTIEYDPAKAQANLRKHGVSFADGERVLRDPRGITIEDPDACGGQRFLTIGTDALGRVLVIVHTPRGASSPLARQPAPRRGHTMRDEYDFSVGRRGAVIPSPGQSQVTLMLDDDLIEHFRKEAESQGTGYQSLINAILRAHVEGIAARNEDDRPVTIAALRRILREELPQGR
jgi:uncharacterized DUF497 family protein